MAGQKTNTPEYIFDKARRYCAYQERSVADLKKKLYEWKVRPEAARKIINRLEQENYLNEERFARMFAGGKFRIKKWGRNRIIAELRARQIPELVIQIGLEEIDEYEYIKTLRQIIEKKKTSFDDPECVSSKNKIYNFALSKGFEKHLILKYL